MAKIIQITLTDASYARLQQIAQAQGKQAWKFVWEEMKAAIARGLHKAAVESIQSQIVALPEPDVSVSDAP